MVRAPRLRSDLVQAARASPENSAPVRKPTARHRGWAVKNTSRHILALVLLDEMYLIEGDLRIDSMYRPTSIAALIAMSLTPGCASTPRDAATVPAATNTAGAAPTSPPSALAKGSGTSHVLSVAHTTDVPVEKNAPAAQGHPMTAVVVTQCNLIVAVYLTMPDGRLLRFDRSANIPAEQLLSMAYTATRSERVEVSCENAGAAGYEHHEVL